MSRINIQGTINNIKARTNVYMSLIEAIVNSIQAINRKGEKNGEIEIIVHRETILELDNSLPNIKSITIIDNGIGFDENSRDSFDTFYSEFKKDIGGKGFGRFLYPKYFTNISVESVYKNEESALKKRSFRFGKEYEIIVEEQIEDTSSKSTYTKLSLNNLKESNFEKNLSTIAKKLLEKLLIYFIDDTFDCPKIIIREEDNSDSIILNEYINQKKEIQPLSDFTFEMKYAAETYNFTAKVFKIYSPANQKSKICLTAHNRVVTDTNLQKFVPEFEDDFYEKNTTKDTKRNFIVRTYVLGEYLNNSVSLERETFNFGTDKSDNLYPFSQNEIERIAADKTKEVFSDEISLRSGKKKSRIEEYVRENAPWHSNYLNDLNLSEIGYNVSNDEIEIALHKIKHKKEIRTRVKFQKFFSNPESLESDEVSNLVKEISEIGKSDLAHYVCNRKYVIETLKELLKRDDNGKTSLEKEIHNLIYPMRSNSKTISYEDHNLWLIDERLVFSEFISSDEKISSSKNDDALGEPDLVIFNKRQAFRRGDNSLSNPLTIFEFKRPKRKNYKGDEDDPIKQISGYLDKIRDGKYEMPEGLEPIQVGEGTPVYAYVIADITEKIKQFAKTNQLIQSADKQGYFGYHNGYEMYVEIISYKKLLDDASLRNKIFFDKLQIS